MNRADYIGIAGAIRHRLQLNQHHDSNHTAILLVMHEIADYMAEENTSFNRNSFIASCEREANPRLEQYTSTQ